MANVMKLMRRKAKVERDGEDMSHRNLFSAKIGEYLPVSVIDCLPNDYGEIDLSAFSRTMPVNTAAFTRIKEYYDWYFVPYNQIWNRFNYVINDLREQNGLADSIHGSTILSDKVPYITDNQIQEYLAKCRALDAKNMFGFSKSSQAVKLLHYLGYGDFRRWGYGNAANPESYNIFPEHQDNAEVNVWDLCAYQKIYNDYLRDSNWERSFAPRYNLNYITGSSDLNVPINELTAGENSFFDIQYANWNKDYFMGILPNSQSGSPASVDLSTLLAPTYVNGITLQSTATGSDLSTQNVAAQVVNNPPFNSALYIGGKIDNGFNAAAVEKLANAMGLTQQKLSSAFTVLALRVAEAKQHYSEVHGSNRQDVKSQMEAHWDVTLDDALSDTCFYLGGTSGNIDISEVVNQNLADGNAAEIAGKGVGALNGKIKFRTKVHGVLMCIYHSVPLLDYSGTGIRARHLKTSFIDYALPEFDRVGLQKLPRVQLTNTKLTGANVYPELLGYGPMYQEYKTNIDEVHGAFYDGGLDAWVAPLTDSYIRQLFSYVQGLGINTVSYHFFKINPHILDPIFTSDVGDYTDSDKIIVNSYFDINMVRSLSRDSFPW